MNNKVISNYENKVEKIEQSLVKVIDDINVLQKGDGQQSFWNGAMACDSVKSIISVSKKIDDLLEKLKTISKKEK